MLIRRAQEPDSETLWQWRNDPVSIRNSISGGVIEWEDHSKWFQNSLQSTSCEIFVGVCEEFRQLVGMVRFDIDVCASTSEVSINMDPNWRGKRVSSLLLGRTIKVFGANRSLLLIARIKPQNTVSIKCFQNCGFELESQSGKLWRLIKNTTHNKHSMK